MSKVYGDVTHYSTTETAQFVREELKERFPDVRFSVRSKEYTGGSTIRIAWSEGPLEEVVRATTAHYQGEYYDLAYDEMRPRLPVAMDGKLARFNVGLISLDRSGPPPTWPTGPFSIVGAGERR